jgi:hypothetical protein
MADIRPFVGDDASQVVHLHRIVFGGADGAASATLDSYRKYFTRVFLDRPSRDAALPSLVYQEKDGRIIGFLGVAARKMRMNGYPLRAAVSSHFMVDPAAHASLVAVRLVKAFLQGPQDLSIADEANDEARRLWEGLGGYTSLVHSLHWTRALRPAQFALSFVRQRRSLKPFALLAEPIARVADMLANRLPRSYFYQSTPALLADDLTDDTVPASLPKFAGDKTLRVEYDERTFRNLLELADAQSGGRVERVVIRNEREVVGWYVYRVDSAGVADVVQIVATPRAIDGVVEHLFHHAWRRGAVAVRGRLDPGLVQVLSDKYCVFHRRGPWMLVNSKRSDVVRAFERGDVFMSRLDGEWCLRF